MSTEQNGSKAGTPSPERLGSSKRWTIQRGIKLPAKCFTCNARTCAGCRHEKAFKRFGESLANDQGESQTPAE